MVQLQDARQRLVRGRRRRLLHYEPRHVVRDLLHHLAQFADLEDLRPLEQVHVLLQQRLYRLLDHLLLIQFGPFLFHLASFRRSVSLVRLLRIEHSGAFALFLLLHLQFEVVDDLFEAGRVRDAREVLEVRQRHDLVAQDGLRDYRVLQHVVQEQRPDEVERQVALHFVPFLLQTAQVRLHQVLRDVDQLLQVVRRLARHYLLYELLQDYRQL